MPTTFFASLLIVAKELIGNYCVAAALQVLDRWSTNIRVGIKFGNRTVTQENLPKVVNFHT